MRNVSNNGAKVVAIVGGYQSGKTSLMESLLFTNNTISKKGDVISGSSVGDHQPTSRSFKMTTEVNIASTQYQDQKFTFLDCPGSVELSQHTEDALSVCDAAVVVAEPKIEKAAALTETLNYLDRNNIPHLIFLNKIETLEGDLSPVIEEIQKYSERPLLVKEIPVKENGKVVGFIDLISERAYRFDPEKPSSLMKLPENLRLDEEEARARMLEILADYNDTLMENILSDIEPTCDEINENIVKDIQEDLVVPVVMGGSIEDNGTRHLMQELYNETPDPDITLKRLNIAPTDSTMLQVFKTSYLPHKGKVSYARTWSTAIESGSKMAGSAINSLMASEGTQMKATGRVNRYDIAVVGKMDNWMTGSFINDDKIKEAVFQNSPKLFGVAIKAEKKSDELKLSSSIAKLLEEDRSLSVEFDENSHQFILWGQGERHTAIALENLGTKYNLKVTRENPKVQYRETLQKPVKSHGRYKKQNGGHGQFGDVHLEVEPLPRGSGFVFEEKITGGAIPSNYFSSIENGVKEYLQSGPLGFQVEDIKVTLVDGTFHKVDSSDQAFKMAAIIGMKDALEKAEPLLLEPIYSVDISVPSEAISSMQSLVTGHRGNILGFEDEERLPNWSVIRSQIPSSEIQNLITEIRSLTHGLGFFGQKFDHLQELSGKLADKVLHK